MGTIWFAIHGDPDRYRTAIGNARTRRQGFGDPSDVRNLLQATLTLPSDLRWYISACESDTNLNSHHSIIDDNTCVNQEVLSEGNEDCRQAQWLPLIYDYYEISHATYELHNEFLKLLKDSSWLSVKMALKQIAIWDICGNVFLLQELKNKMARFNCITKEIEGHIRIVIDMLEKNIDSVSDSIENMNGHAKIYSHYTREAGINLNQLKQTGRSMRDAMPIMYQATLSLPTDLQCNEDNNNKEKKGTTMRDKPYISKAERKKLKKGQTQGEVGDAGEVKENVAKKKKVKVGEMKVMDEQ
ncbi:hypothetical protein Tco_0555647 [Tanacetum coccineum]